MGDGKGKKDEGQKNEKSSEEKNGVTVVLKTEMHCEGCATKILKCVKTIEGVEKAKAEWEANKLTVKGGVDPPELREELQERLGKKVELISPQLPKKSDKDGSAVTNKGGDSKKKDDGKKKDDDKKKDDGKKSDDKKPKEKEAPVTTAVLKLRLHCMGCIVKIHKLVSKTEGVKSISIDKEKELVSVTGTMDVKALAESLEEKMKRPVAIVPPKKEKDGGGGGGEGNKDGGGGGGEGNKDGGGGGGGKKNKKNDGDEAAGGDMFEGNRMEYVGVPLPSYGPMYGQGQGPGYGYPYPYANPYTYGNNLHASQMFSDENPNACSVM